MHRKSKELCAYNSLTPPPPWHHSGSVVRCRGTQASQHPKDSRSPKGAGLVPCVKARLFHSIYCISPYNDIVVVVVMVVVVAVVVVVVVVVGGGGGVVVDNK